MKSVKTNQSNKEFMKSSLLFLAILGLSLTSCGQGTQSNIKDSLKSVAPDTIKTVDNRDFSSYDSAVTPSYPGGDEELLNFVHKNLHYPPSALKNKLEGRVTIRFTVEADGKVTNAKVIRGLSPDCDKEALRIVNMMPRWIPMQRPRSCDYTLPIVFKLYRPGPLNVK